MALVGIMMVLQPKMGVDHQHANASVLQKKKINSEHASCCEQECHENQQHPKDCDGSCGQNCHCPMQSITLVPSLLNQELLHVFTLNPIRFPAKIDYELSSGYHKIWQPPKIG